MEDIFDDIKNNLFIVFIILFYFYWLIFIVKNSALIFFALILLYIGLNYYKEKKKKIHLELGNIEAYINKIEKELSLEKEIWGNIYFIHKTPKKIIYIRKNKDVCQVIYDLKFIEIYDKDNLYKLIAYLEYFLKIHYNLIFEKYDNMTYFDILKDIRTTILNIMKSFHFNIPRESKILDIDRLSIYIEKRILIIQSITGKYIKIIHHKYGNSHKTYKPPQDLDETKIIGVGKNYNMY